MLLNEHFVGCTRCKGKNRSAGSLVNLEASAHFTNDLRNFAEYEPYQSPYEINAHYHATNSAWAGKKVTQRFKLADIGEGITECEVIKW